MASSPLSPFATPFFPLQSISSPTLPMSFPFPYVPPHCVRSATFNYPPATLSHLAPPFFPQKNLNPLALPFYPPIQPSIPIEQSLFPIDIPIKIIVTLSPTHKRLLQLLKILPFPYSITSIPAPPPMPRSTMFPPKVKVKIKQRKLPQMMKCNIKFPITIFVPVDSLQHKIFCLLHPKNFPLPITYVQQPSKSIHLDFQPIQHLPPRLLFQSPPLSVPAIFLNKKFIIQILSTNAELNKVAVLKHICFTMPFNHVAAIDHSVNRALDDKKRRRTPCYKNTVFSNPPSFILVSTTNGNRIITSTKVHGIVTKYKKKTKKWVVHKDLGPLTPVFALKKPGHFDESDTNLLNY